MVVELIAKDKNEKFHFQGRCKLIIDSLSKLLLVEPFNEDFKMISAMFKWKFFAQKNILFVFAEYNFQDFALIFDNPEKCHKAYGFLVKKGAISGNKELINQRFLSSIFNEISANNESSLKMKEIFFKWIRKFNGKEKEEYIQILKDYNVYDLFFSNTVRELPKNLRKRKAKDVIYGKESINGSTSNRLTNKNLKKGSSDKPQNLPVLRKIIEEPNFEILKYFQNGRSRIKLSVFPSSEERKYCYEYYWQESKSCYVCSKCCHQRKFLTAKILKRNGKDVVQLNETQHVCKLKENKVVIEKPDYEFRVYEHGGSISKRIILFLDSSHKFCYEYYPTSKLYLCCGCVNKKHHVGADIYQKEDGTEFILSLSSNHVCEPRKFNSVKYGEKEIVEADNFKVFNDIENGIDKSKLVIFTSPDQSKCYEYSWKNSEKKFICQRCHTKMKRVTAEMCEKNDRSAYLKLNKAKHVCEPIIYNPDKFDPSKKEIIESSNFKIFKYKHNGAEISKLIIFCETNKNLCYEFHWVKSHQKYYCSYCPMENRPSASVCQNENSKDYLILSKAKHVCDLHEFDPEKYKDDVKIDKSMYDLTSTTTRNNKILIIFTSQEKKTYYKFVYYRQMKYFYCSKCFSFSKIYITATLQNEGTEDECIFMSSQKHICQPFEHSLIKEPDFKLFEIIWCKKTVKKLAVFDSKNRNMGYIYTYQEKKKKYICKRCSYNKNYVYAKVITKENGQTYVQLGDNEHVCQQQKI